MEKRLRWYWRNPSDFARGTWMKHVKVNGRWAYLYRAVSGGRTVDFISSSRRGNKAAYRFLGKSTQQREEVARSRFINTDKAPGRALGAALKNAKAGARLTLNTDRLSTGTT
ncbi:hypothetical protein ECZU28_48960 [Escherichia coli]|nr:hypothetical protein ECZU28_48960 [Escherichia coli]